LIIIENKEMEETKYGPGIGFKIEDNVVTGKLFIVSTPIGNRDDISVRALNALRKSDFVVCESPKEGAALLRNMNIHKEIISMDVKNEEEKAPEIIELLHQGKYVALISDAGTPIFADPGLLLVRLALKSQVKIEVVPGTSSIMTALVRSGFDLSQFLYSGFLSRKTEERFEQIKQLAMEKRTVVLLETPYRIKPLLSAMADIMPHRKAYIGMNLTMPYESHHYGTFYELNQLFGTMKIKAEFVVCIEAAEPNYSIPEYIRNSASEYENEYGNRSSEPRREPRPEYNQQRGYRGKASTNRGGSKPSYRRSSDSDSGRPEYKKPYSDRDSDSGGYKKPYQDRDYDKPDYKKPYDESGSERPYVKKPYEDRDSSGRPPYKKPYSDRDSSGKPPYKKPYEDRDSSGKPGI